MHCCAASLFIEKNFLGQKATNAKFSMRFDRKNIAMLKLKMPYFHYFQWKAKDDVAAGVEDAVVKSVTEWYTFVKLRIIKLESDKSSCTVAATSSSSSSTSSGSDDHMDEDTVRMVRLKKLARLTHLLVADIKSSREHFRQMFRDTLNIDYVEVLVR